MEYAEALGDSYVLFSGHDHRKNGGHYLTPAAVARFMAGRSSYSEPHMRVLDPGSGTGILSAAVCEEAHRSGTVKTLHVDAYETDGLLAELSPGRHNRLQAQVVTDFGPKFAPGAILLYLGDAANKILHLDRERLAELGVPITEHDKLPDVVLYEEARNWLFLIEAVTSHGPVTPKRVEELEATLKDCTATRVYVSAFPDFREFKRHVDKIAWETEVWLAEIPDHLIHFNGDKFLGPRVN